jgi:hypothetical protein
VQELLLGHKQLLKMLDAATQHRNAEAVKLLAALPAAQQLDAATLSCLANTALELQDSASLHALCQLPGMQQVSRQQLESLLLVAGTYHCGAGVRLPGQQLKAATDVPPHVLFAMLSMAVQARPAMVEDLLVFPLSSQLSAQDAEQLLDQAVTSVATAAASAAGLDNGVVSTLLKQLPAAADISGAALLRMMRSAVIRAAQHVLGQLCKSPAVSEITATEFVTLFQLALEANAIWAVPNLCQLPVAEQLHHHDFGHLLRVAMVYHRPGADNLVKQLCAELPDVADALEPEQVGCVQQKAGCSASSCCLHSF